MKSKTFILKYIISLSVIFFCNGQSDINTGFLLLEHGNFKSAEVFFNEYLKVNPDNKTAYLCYGRAVGLNGNPQLAQSIFDELISEEPNNIEFQMNYAESLLWNKKFKEALTYYTKLLKLDKENPILFLGLANTYANLKEYKKAITNYRKGLEINSEVLGLYIGLAYTLHANKQSQAALECIDKAMSIKNDILELKQLKQQIAEFYQIQIDQKTSVSFDSGKDYSERSSLSINLPVNKSINTKLYYKYRDAENRDLNTQAIQQIFGLKVVFPISFNWSINGGVSYLKNRGDKVYDELLFNGEVTKKFRDLSQVSFKFERNIQDFNTSLINEQISQHHISASFHKLFKNQFGCYTQINTHFLSDANKNISIFSSLYYNIKRKFEFKIGTNFQYLSFSEERPTTYFSPKQLSSSEIFLDFNLKSKNKSLYVSGLIGYGYQTKDFEMFNNTMRFKLDANYILNKKFSVALFGRYSNNSISNASQFNFSEMGLLLKYKI